MRVRSTLALALAAPLALLTACGPGEAADPGDVQVLAECVTATECPSLDPDAFARLVAGDGVVVLDVRTPQEYAEGHLAGAVNVDVSAADFPARVAELDPAGTYAVYCRSGNRSRVALAALQDAGITSAADLAGGVVAWADAGLPLTTG